MIDAITLELYRDIAQNHESWRDQVRKRHTRGARIATAWSVVFAGLGAASTDYPPLFVASVAFSASYAMKAQRSRQQAERAHSSYPDITTQLFYHPDGFVTLNTKGCGLEEIVDGRTIERAGLEIDERPTLVTNVSVEAIGDKRYLTVADLSLPTDYKPGTYDWLVVRKLRGQFDVLSHAQNSGTTLASTSTV